MAALNNVRRRPLVAALCLCMLALAMFLVPPLFAWQSVNERRALSLSNVRRLALAVQLYAQDFDDCLMPPATRLPGNVLLSWTMRASPYGASERLLDNPANPLSFAQSRVTEPHTGCTVQSGYALNRRFFGTFGHGPFLLDNLELPAQTALIVEAGPMWSSTGRSESDHPSPHPIAVIEYGDTEDRYRGLVPYPSSHGGRFVIAAADGHAVAVRVEHYTLQDGPHDPLYGRIGGDIYNWNGGHLNGATDLPAHE